MSAVQGQTDQLPCPRCGRRVPIAADLRPAGFPFCSERCRLLDLGAWIDGKHAIAGRGGEDGQE
ncbi:MAG TPA: DNA gyrase inhibitor YacG [Planctomycetes bacterium]|nr:DNA gyrase inhibitor YacG [Planctomycetota bacterium]